MQTHNSRARTQQELCGLEQQIVGYQTGQQSLFIEWVRCMCESYIVNSKSSLQKQQTDINVIRQLSVQKQSAMSIHWIRRVHMYNYCTYIVHVNPTSIQRGIRKNSEGTIADFATDLAPYASPARNERSNKWYNVLSTDPGRKSESTTRNERCRLSICTYIRI